MFCWLKKGLSKICKHLVIVVDGGDDAIKLTSAKIYLLVKTKTVRLLQNKGCGGGGGTSNLNVNIHRVTSPIKCAERTLTWRKKIPEEKLCLLSLRLQFGVDGDENE